MLEKPVWLPFPEDYTRAHRPVAYHGAIPVTDSAQGLARRCYTIVYAAKSVHGESPSQSTVCFSEPWVLSVDTPECDLMNRPARCEIESNRTDSGNASHFPRIWACFPQSYPPEVLSTPCWSLFSPPVRRYPEAWRYCILLALPRVCRSTSAPHCAEGTIACRARARRRAS